MREQDLAKDRAAANAASHMRAAVAEIDAVFGEGYAARNPALVAAFLQTAAIEHAVQAGRAASRETNETLLKLKPRLFG